MSFLFAFAGDIKKRRKRILNFFLESKTVHKMRVQSGVEFFFIDLEMLETKGQEF